jgi:hypothetical protein
MGWTGLLAIARGGTNSATVITAPTATSWAGWDANSNLSANNYIQGFLNTARSNSSVYTLTVASAAIQDFSGTGGTITGDSVTMPVVSTLVKGMTWTINNVDTVNVLKVNSSGGNLIYNIQPNQTCTFTCVAITGTSASSWVVNSGLAPQGQYLFFTPTLTFQTVGNLSVAYTTQRGRYSISGNICYFWLAVAGTLTWTTSSGQLRITGLPATPNTVGNGDFTGMNLTNISGLALTSGAKINPVVSEGSPIVFLNVSTPTSSSSALMTTSSVPTGTVLNIGVSGWFMI